MKKNKKNPNLTCVGPLAHRETFAEMVERKAFGFGVRRCGLNFSSVTKHVTLRK